MTGLLVERVSPGKSAPREKSSGVPDKMVSGPVADVLTVLRGLTAEEKAVILDSIGSVSALDEDEDNDA